MILVKLFADRKKYKIEQGKYDGVGIGYSDDPFKEWALDNGHLGTFHMCFTFKNAIIKDTEKIQIECNDEDFIKQMVIPDRIFNSLVPEYESKGELPDTQTTMFVSLFREEKIRHLIIDLFDMTIIEKEKIITYHFDKTLEHPVTLLVSEKQDGLYVTKKSAFTIRTIRQKNEVEIIGKNSTLEECLKIHEAEIHGAS